jgi:transposase
MTHRTSTQRSRIGLSVQQCRERRADIARAVRSGATTREAAAGFGVSVATVDRACAANGVTIGPHGEAGVGPVIRRRWKRIAEAVAGGKSVAEAAAEFNVCKATAQRACRAHGVKALTPGRSAALERRAAAGRFNAARGSRRRPVFDPRSRKRGSRSKVTLAIERRLTKTTEPLREIGARYGVGYQRVWHVLAQMEREAARNGHSRH